MNKKRRVADLEFENKRLEARVRVLENQLLAPAFGKPHGEVLGRMLEIQHRDLSTPYACGLANGIYTSYVAVTGVAHPLGLVDVPAEPPVTGRIILP